jgi:AcrR family transcriptional regulator
MASRAARSEATRAALLEAAAAELVAGDGVIEVGNVAARAGVSTGALYHHFGSKAGLLGMLVRDFYERMHERVIEPTLREHGDWSARERARIQLSVALHYDDPLAIVIATLAREPEVAAAEAPYTAELVAMAERNLRAAQRAGELPSDFDPGIAAAMIMGGLRQALGEVLARERRPPRKRVVEELWRIVGSAVGATERVSRTKGATR